MSGRTRGRDQEPANGYSFHWLVLTATLVLWSGCSLQRPLQSESIDGLGRIEYRKAQTRFSGTVVGVAHGTSEPAAVSYASAIADATGAGIVIAYGFGSKRVAVTRPLERTEALKSLPPQQRSRVSIYPEFKTLLQKSAEGPIKFYVGVRVARKSADLKRIEVATTGFSFAQAKLLKEAFVQIRDRELHGKHLDNFDIALDPPDRLSWSTEGLKHHGVLMLADKGLSVWLPSALADEAAQRAYTSILVEWVHTAIAMATKITALPQVRVTRLRYGKFELIPSAGERKGIVVAAPHGTFDAYTAGMVRRICSRTGVAAVIATGFTPTESNDGWRINVNRPTELRIDTSGREIKTERAKLTYEHFKRSVLGAARGNLNLYVDIHQNGGARIEVATVGVSKTEARTIKEIFYALRDQMLGGEPDMAMVDLAIEPVDELEVGAWAAKTNGILTVARRSLHFELPAALMASARQRDIYTVIIGKLVGQIAGELTSRR
jgi:hypothetical protein